MPASPAAKASVLALVLLGCPSAEAPSALADASSPYLRQHASDAVDWRPWGEAAFAAARSLDRPILLSIGYSSCHWCHVMAEESWRDPEISALVDARFVAVLVDREERPDVDDVYLRVATSLGVSPAWPLTLVLAPDGSPIFAGTYLPARDGDRGAKVGLLTVLGDVVTRWDTDRDALVAEAADRSREVRELSRPSPPGRVPGPEVTALAAERTHAAYDAVHGGFGGAPKFPTPVRIDGLLAHAARTGDEDSRTEALDTLRALARSALHDPLAGGFHRYAVDVAWQVPHYEKMTADAAALVGSYVSGWQASGDPLFADTALRTLDWLDTLRRPDGAFATALDADSAGRDGRLAEGAYYTWTRAGLADALGADGARVADALGVGDEPTAPRHVAPVDPALLDRLRAARERRPAPFRDDKAVAAVQGQVVGAYARAGFALARPERVRTAAELAALVLDRMRGPDGRLRRTLAPDSPPGVLEDQAMVADGLLDLFEVTADPRWLSAAVELMDVTGRRFGDPVGGWFRTADDGEALLLRPRPDRDLPDVSGASVAIAVALRLSALTGDPRWQDEADRALASFAEPLRRRPTSLPAMVEALARRHAPPPEIVVSWPEGADPDPLLDVVRRTWIPGRVLLAGSDRALRALDARVPLARDKVAHTAPVAWVCRGGVCLVPSTDPAGLAEAIRASVTLSGEAR